MRKSQFIIVLLLLLTVSGAVALAQDASPGAPGVGDVYYPSLGNGGYDVQHYDLELLVDVETNLLVATATIEAVATQDLSAFNLDFVGMTVAELSVNGEAATFARDEPELVITPAEAIREGDAFTVLVDYYGRPNSIQAQGIPIQIGWRNYGNGILVASQPNGSSTWYPVNDHPTDKATYTFRITVEEPYVAAANGILTETIDAGRGATTYVWEASDPTASYLTTVQVAEFVRQEETLDNGLVIRNYFPARVAAEGQRTFAKQGAMMDYFETVFGPYPFEVYGSVVADTPLSFALETQTLSVYGVTVVNGGIGVEAVIAHELAHQWFGNSASTRQWQDIWLNEGFATYAQWLWAEHEYSIETRDDFIRGSYTTASSSFVLPGAAVLGDPSPDRLFDPGVYFRGALTLHALRLEIGDEAFFDTLRTYADRFKNSTVVTDDFIAVAEEVSEQDLGALFDAWVYQDRLPPIPEMDLGPGVS